MRIGLITGEYPPMQGGVGDFTRELARAWVEQGHAVSILTDVRGENQPHPLNPPTPNSGRGTSKPDTSPSPMVERVLGGEVAYHVSSLITRWNWQSLSTVKQWAAARGLDAVNLQFETAAYGMSPWVHLIPTALRPLNVVTTFHDLHAPYLFPKAGIVRPSIVNYLARHSAAVIATNRADAEGLAGRGISNIREIPIGSNIAVDPPPGYMRDDWRSQTLGVPPDAFVIGYFGFLNASKGVDELLRALRQTLDRGIDAYLVMIGGKLGASDPANAAYAALIESLIAQLTLTDRIRWTGYANPQAVSGHLLACDVIALPFKDGVSYRRGSFMAALVHGCAILTTPPATPLPELADAVYTVLPESKALSGGLSKLAADPALRTRLGRNAGVVAGRFSWETIASQTADVLNACLG